MSRVQFLIEPCGDGAADRERVAALWAARARDVVIPPAAACERAVKVGMGVRAVCLRAQGAGSCVGEAFTMHPRSSISKTMLVLANSTGIFDADYRGEVIAAFHNLGSKPVELKAGTCLVQLCAHDLSSGAAHLLGEGDLRAAAFGATARGGGGFGSSGATSDDQ